MPVPTAPVPHEVLDSWFEQRVKPALFGRAFLVRYADDAVVMFADRRDAMRVLEALGRMKRAIKAVSQWCRFHRRWRVREQRRYLSKVPVGYYWYYGVTGNSFSIGRFRQEVQEAWRKCLNRRSQRAKMTWARFHQLSKRYPLPPARAYRSVCRT